MDKPKVKFYMPNLIVIETEGNYTAKAEYSFNDLKKGDFLLISVVLAEKMDACLLAGYNETGSFDDDTLIMLEVSNIETTDLGPERGKILSAELSTGKNQSKDQEGTYLNWCNKTLKTLNFVEMAPEEINSLIVNKLSLNI
jgi:hypothetical protein